MSNAADCSTHQTSIRINSYSIRQSHIDNPSESNRFQVFPGTADTGISSEVDMQLRCGPRISVRYSASVQTDDGAAEGTLFDLSATGCRMQSSVALTPGSYLALHIEAPETESPLAVEVSIVRWHKDNQFGIEFLRYAQGDRERVTDLVEGCEPPAISNHVEHEELTLSTTAA